MDVLRQMQFIRTWREKKECIGVDIPVLLYSTVFRVSSLTQSAISAGRSIGSGISADA